MSYLNLDCVHDICEIITRVADPINHFTLHWIYLYIYINLNGSLYILGHRGILCEFLFDISTYRMYQYYKYVGTILNIIQNKSLIINKVALNSDDNHLKSIWKYFWTLSNITIIHHYFI